MGTTNLGNQPRQPHPQPQAAQGDAQTLTVSEAADLVGVSRQAIEKRLKAGDLTRQRIIRQGRALVGVSAAELAEAYPRIEGAVAPIEPDNQVGNQRNHPPQPVAQPIQEAPAAVLADLRERLDLTAAELAEERQRAQEAVTAAALERDRRAQAEAAREAADLERRRERDRAEAKIEELAQERERRARAEGEAETAKAQATELTRAVTVAQESHAESEKQLRTLALELGEQRGRVAQLPVGPATSEFSGSGSGHRIMESARPWLAALVVGAVALGTLAVRSELRAREAAETMSAAVGAADGLRGEVGNLGNQVADLRDREAIARAEAVRASKSAAAASSAADLAQRTLLAERCERAALEASRAGRPLAAWTLTLLKGLSR